MYSTLFIQYIDVFWTVFCVEPSTELLTIGLFFGLKYEIPGSDPGKGKYDFYISDV